ncbi:MAG: glycosyltransferase family 4 protein [Bacteroidota bacterium]
MRIVYILENYFPNVGGVETLFKSLVESLAKEGHDITVVTSRTRPDLRLKEVSSNLTIVRLPFNNRYLFTFLAFFYAFPYVRKCDLVHTTSYNAGVPAFFAAKLLGKKVIITFHEVWADLWFRLPYMGTIGKWAHYLFEQFLLRLPFTIFVGVSKSTTANLRKAKVSSRRVLTIYNGINYDEFHVPVQTSETTCFTYTYFGRLGISKGLDILMKAIPVIHRRYPNCRFQLIVPAEPTNFLQKIHAFIIENSLSESVLLRHHLPFEVLKRAISHSDCVVIPSYSEGFCFAAVEAIALGTPVISSDQTALKEVVCQKFIKMKEFSVEGLISAMDDAKKGNWQTSPLRKFNLSTTIQAYKQLYQQLV